MSWLDYLSAAADYPPWLSPSQLAELHPNEAIHNMCRTLDQQMYYVNRAKSGGVTITSLMGSQAANTLRIQYASYLIEANRWRVLTAYIQTGVPPLSTWEAHITDARAWWSRQRAGLFSRWPAPDVMLIEKVKEFEQWPW